MTEQEIKAYLNYEDVQKELEEAKAIIKELKLALITRDGNLTNKLIHDELTRLRSDLQQKDEWISVKDSLPNDEQLVLMYHDQQYFIGWLQIVYSDGYAVFKETNGLYNIPATHWKSLDPPKSKAK